jgi:hypothetical protein
MTLHSGYQPPLNPLSPMEPCYTFPVAAPAAARRGNRNDDLAHSAPFAIPAHFLRPFFVNGGLCEAAARLAGPRSGIATLIQPVASRSVARAATAPTFYLEFVMKSEIPSLNPVEAALAQAAIDTAASLTPDFQSEIEQRLHIVSSAVDCLALYFAQAESGNDQLEPGALWGVARLISNETKVINNLHNALHETLKVGLKGEVRS